MDDILLWFHQALADVIWGGIVWEQSGEKAWSNCPPHREWRLNGSSQNYKKCISKTWKHWHWWLIKTSSIHNSISASNILQVIPSCLFLNTFRNFLNSSQTFQLSPVTVVKLYCSKCFCREQHISFQMDGGPCWPCGVWFLISVIRQWCKLTKLQRTICPSLQHSSGELLKGSVWGQRRKQWHRADNNTIQ